MTLLTTKNLNLTRPNMTSQLQMADGSEAKVQISCFSMVHLALCEVIAPEAQSLKHEVVPALENSYFKKKTSFPSI